MESYKILWKQSAERDLRNIDKQYIPRIIGAVESLADNPLTLQSCKLRGAKNFYRIRVGDFRIIFQIEINRKRVIVYYIRHRKKIYRKF